MAEINNIPNFGITNKKVDNKLNKDIQQPQPTKEGEVVVYLYLICYQLFCLWFQNLEYY